MEKMRDEIEYLQTQLPGTTGRMEDAMLVLTIPICSYEDLTRVGWTLREGPKQRLVAMTTGKSVWTYGDLEAMARWITILVDEVRKMVMGQQHD